MPMTSVLLADITGSTALYDRLGQHVAMERVSTMLARLREIAEGNGGRCIKTQGDDALCRFDAPGAGYVAARQMLSEPWPHGLNLHAGLYWGEAEETPGDMFGDAVNVAARLATLAKAGEILAGNAAVEALDDTAREAFLPIGRIRLKGKAEATRVYSITQGASDGRTTIAGGFAALTRARTESAEFRSDDGVWHLTEGQSLTVGRAEDCDIRLSEPWVSRQHGRLELRGAVLEYADHSSAGSAVLPEDGPAVDVHRRAVPLMGTGVLLFGTGDQSAAGARLSYATNDLIPE
ncbi:adenylate/guanylate cyclase domain-containing protein [Ruegeria sp. WL0004]|uniref:Adenylate/guanylate cyclase domain-containing protein n=1 Tax=Ruegeria marisflavi TaxID=2984152 RepID=A0ABT2WTC1_9RHOB|nr:adenylate/guanylate cyclase domain-containing protein [Ruegeria sp. WL0004]MCU9838883.1 adenylate/guanylate cyclase domain-containing protein [Ruegeria sp. WL0004]